MGWRLMFIQILGALGGVVAFIGAVWIIVRAVFNQSNVTKENTMAVQELNRTVRELSAELHRQGERIARLEGRWTNRAESSREI